MAGLHEAEKRARSNNARFIAYLEKHRIYELFHEIATQLLIQKPDDHLVFMKQYLELAARRLDISKIILIAPPGFDKNALADVLREELGVHPLTLHDLQNASSQQDIPCHCDESENLARAMRKILETGAFHRCGWILVDLPRTKKEARIFQRTGIIPTHVIQLIVSKENDNLCHICTNETSHDISNPVNHAMHPKNRTYLKNVRELREVYANCLIEIEVGVRSIVDLGRDCAKLATVKKHCGAPSLFRIALIGSRGSGCNTLAKHLVERFNLVHSNIVDYDYIAQQARLQQNSLGCMLRLFEHKWGQRPKPEIRMQIVEKHISGYECLKRGWVLTGYPKTLEDFKLLDLSPTPPNRVIFIEVLGDVCRERLLNRRYNIYTGSKHHLFTEKYTDGDNCKLGVHPKDFRLTVERDLQEYEENLADMMQYAGESAVKIDGNEDERIVREKVEASLMRPALPATLRIRTPPPDIDPKIIEFDPDDEPDSSVFDQIRAPEPEYTFI